MISLLSDPAFYFAAIPAVILVGLSKGGLGGAMALMGVPMLSLVVSPVQAAAILLPILIVMDIVSLWAWRGYRDRRTLWIMLPGAFVGIAIGWATAAIVTEAHARLIVGLVTLAFFLRWVFEKLAGRVHIAEQSRPRGMFWGGVAGFTSFVAHAGGPPYQVYALPLRQDPRVYTGTSVVFFAIVNAVKLIPYFALGQFDRSNLMASLMLIPVAPLATLVGVWLIKRMKPSVFYPFMYVMVLIVSLKLIHDGVSDLMGW
ncbi:sulfite exporter TauE/SafE family protein [Nitratireductor kimnyeongensis]|uniref:Probable membrane transporter protein n=1 Tax=Nitratireductor kimnyeongensis TaxID=430679 RepID=A0ABW0TAD3_9HYPH|nr:sulfite exporter TauE/SafE family protein [Nitratireductor kimnyeongensis]QZZ36586.1 sulfite exporter TauE/SafE family protein [Nitratireductor kimnyeongensis]